MKKITVCIALAALLALGGQAFAAIGTVDDVPAATLLLPYFEVNLDDPDAMTTLFSINNASAAPAIAHVTLWTDLSIPTIDFNVYLTGYDVYTINLRDLFNGTAGPPTDSIGVVSPVGAFSLASKPAPFSPGTCADQLPLPNLPSNLLNKIRAFHTGGSFNGDCAGVNHGDNVARGYITVDNANVCGLDFPGSAGYFVDGGLGDASNDNQLWGEYFLVDTSNNFAQGETMVHIEADDTLGLADDYTFYRRYSAGADNREGLTSSFAARYATSFGPLEGGTDFLVWRDGQQDDLAEGPGICGGVLPEPYPMAQNQIVIFDEEENPEITPGNPFSGIPDPEAIRPFPWETQRVSVGSDAFPVGFASGWVYANLNNDLPGSEVQPPDGNLANRLPDVVQNWMTNLLFADGRFSVGQDAIQLDNVTEAATARDDCLQNPDENAGEPIRSDANCP